MKRTLLVSVAAIALAAGSTVALSQGQGGGSTPMANPSGGGAAAPGASGGAGMNETHPGGKAGAPAKGAQERGGMEKQKSTQQAPQGGPAATTKQSQGEKSAQPSKQSMEETSGQPSTKQSQAPAHEKQDKQQQGQATPHQQPGQAAPTQHSQGQSTTTTTTKQGAAERPMKSSNVSLTTEQKTKIRTTVLTSSAPRVTSVNFDIKVGTVVPRTVHIVPVPVTLVTIEPEWRGLLYFVYNDEIIIVRPGTLEIVAIVAV